MRHISTDLVICEAALRREHIPDHRAIPGSIPDWYLANQSALLTDLRRSVVSIEQRLSKLEAYLFPPPPAPIDLWALD